MSGAPARVVLLASVGLEASVEEERRCVMKAWFVGVRRVGRVVSPRAGWRYRQSRHASWLVFDSDWVGRGRDRGVAVRERCCAILCGRKAMTYVVVLMVKGRSKGRAYNFTDDKKPSAYRFTSSPHLPRDQPGTRYRYIS